MLLARHSRPGQSRPFYGLTVRVGGAVAVVALGLVGGLGVGAALGESTASVTVAALGATTVSGDEVREQSNPASRSADRPLIAPSTPATGETVPAESPSEGSREPDLDPSPPPLVLPENGSGILVHETEGAPTGVFDVASGEMLAPSAGTVQSVRIEVEDGLPVDTQVFADAVMDTLNDPRGWSAPDGVSFARTSAEDAAIRVVLASPATTDQLCAPLQTNGKYSCGVTGIAVLNFDRWVAGSPDFGTDVVTYRQYVVNHEVGHVIGHRHESCPAPGALAPVMVQQSMSAQGCVVNGWPNPEAAS